MAKLVSFGGVPIETLFFSSLALILVTVQLSCASSGTFASNKVHHPKQFYGLAKDTDTSREKKSSLLDDEGMRFKKGSLLDDEGLRFKKGTSLLDDEGLRFKKTQNDLFERNPLVRKSVLDGEGMRFKKGSSLLDDEGMRFRRSRIQSLKDRLDDIDPAQVAAIKRYFPSRFFSFYPFNLDLTNSYERRSDRSGNRDILEGEGMRF